MNPMAPATSSDPTAVVARRFLGAAIDVGILLVFSTVYWLLASRQLPALLRGYDLDPCIGQTMCTSLGDRYVSGWPMFFLALVWVAYLVGVFFLQRGLTGRTVGTMLVGLVVVGEDGRPVGVGRAVIRCVAGAVDWLPCCVPLVGIVTVAAAPGHRRVGDMAASSYVVDNEWFGRRIELPGPALPPPPPVFPGAGYPAQPPVPPAPAPPVTTSALTPPPAPPAPGSWGSPHGAPTPPPTIAPAPPAAAPSPDEPSGEPAGPPPAATRSPSPFAPPGAPAPVVVPEPAGTPTPGPPGERSDGPVWDPERRAYLQWDPQRGRWLQFDQADQEWQQYDEATGRWRPVDR